MVLCPGLLLKVAAEQQSARSTFAAWNVLARGGWLTAREHSVESGWNIA